MESSDKILSNISRLIDKLISANNTLRKENNQLLAERERLTLEKMRLSGEVKRLKRESEVKNVYNSLIVSEGDKAKAKRQLERILREIDGCIDMLKSKE